MAGSFASGESPRGRPELGVGLRRVVEQIEDKTGLFFVQADPLGLLDHSFGREERVAQNEVLEAGAAARISRAFSAGGICIGKRLVFSAATRGMARSSNGFTIGLPRSKIIVCSMKAGHLSYRSGQEGPGGERAGPSAHGRFLRLRLVCHALVGHELLAKGDLGHQSP